MNIMYHQNGDCLLPDMGLNETDKTPLNKYGRMRMRYLQEYRPGLYTRLLLSGKLYGHLKEAQEAAQTRMGKIEADMAKEQGIDEALKAQDQMAWVGAMNMIRHQAEEIVFLELIYN
ncbi:MAG: TnpV protein [Clostridia bacterium]|nr:TnpV protein [Clostridia bacterium]